MLLRSDYPKSLAAAQSQIYKSKSLCGRQLFKAPRKHSKSRYIIIISKSLATIQSGSNYFKVPKKHFKHLSYSKIRVPRKYLKSKNKVDGKLFRVQKERVSENCKVFRTNWVKVFRNKNIQVLYSLVNKKFWQANEYQTKSAQSGEEER